MLLATRRRHACTIRALQPNVNSGPYTCAQRALPVTVAQGHLVRRAAGCTYPAACGGQQTGLNTAQRVRDLRDRDKEIKGFD